MNPVLYMMIYDDGNNACTVDCTVNQRCLYPFEQKRDHNVHTQYILWITVLYFELSAPQQLHVQTEQKRVFTTQKTVVHLPLPSSE